MTDETPLSVSAEEILLRDGGRAHIAFARGAASRFLLMLWLLSVVVNLAATLFVTGINNVEPGSDESGYYDMARELLELHQFSSIYRTPVYPGLLAGVFAVTGPSVAVGKVFNCLVGGLTPVGIYCLCRLLFPGLAERKPRGAGLIAALLPTLLSVNATLYSETLSTAMFIWFNVLLVYLLTRISPSADQRDREGTVPRAWGSWLGIGAALGLLVLTKPQHVFFVPFLVLSAIWLFRRALGRLPGIFAVAGVGFCLVLSPWWSHNWRETGGYFVPFTTSGDRTLVDANNPTIARLNQINVIGGRKVWEGAGKFLFKIEDNELVDMSKVEPMDEVHRARYFRAQALHWIASHPGEWAVLCVKKLGYGFGLWPLWQGSWSTLVLNIAFGLILLFSIPGWWLIARRPGWHRLLLLHLLTYLSLTIVFFGSLRYRNPFEGSFIIAAVLGASALIAKVRRDSVSDGGNVGGQR